MKKKQNTSRNSFPGASGALLFATAAFLPASIQAQTDRGFSIEEVIVTARRRSESLQDVPGTVTALTSSTLETAGVSRAEDFIAMTPGVTMVNAAEVGDTQVNIRGINGARDAENSFAYLVDGILYTNPAAFNREYTNLQQIEIFKGPQGAIYGRSAAAGAILVTTEAPSGESRFSGRVSAAGDSTNTAQLAYSAPLADNVYFGLSADWRETDGFYRNNFQNNAAVVDTYEGYNINGRLVWDVNESLNIDTKLRIGEVDASSITYNSVFHLPVFAAAQNIPEANQDSNTHNFVFNPNITSDNDQETFELSTKFEYEMENSVLTGWALYSDVQNDLIADGSSAAFGFYNGDSACIQSVTELNSAGFALPAPQFIGQNPTGVIFDPMGSFLGAFTPTTCDGIQEQVRDQKDFSVELRLASSGDADLNWMAGIYYLDIDRQVGVSLNRDSGQAPIRGLLQTSGPNQTASLVYDDFQSQVFSVFGQIEYDLNDRTELALALRYDNEKRDVSSLVPTNVTQSVIDLNFDGIFNDPLNPGLSSLVNPNGVIPDQSETFTQLQPKLTLGYDLTDNTRLFASWGVGFKAGGFNNSGSAATVNIFINGFINGFIPGTTFAADLGNSLPIIADNYEEETSNAFEAGFKSSLLDGRLKLDGAVYHTQIDDMQFFEFYVGSFGLLRVVSNIDKVDVTGVELGASYVVSENFSLSAGANFIDSEINANSSRPDTVGNESPYTPESTFNIAADFNFPLENELEVFTRLDAQMIGKTWFHTIQEGQRATIFQPLFEAGFGPGAGALGIADYSNAQRDSYTTANLRLGISGENWTIAGFVHNLTDEKYLEEVIPAPEFGGTFDHPGTQRRAGLEASFNF